MVENLTRIQPVLLSTSFVSSLALFLLALEMRSHQRHGALGASGVSLGHFLICRSVTNAGCKQAYFSNV